MNIITNNSNIYGVEIKSYNDYIYNHSITINKLWDEEIVNEVLNNYIEGTDILDIGANIGLITLGITKKAKERNINLGNIHCFECDTHLFNLLESNVSSLNNVNLYPFAVAQKELLCNLSLLDSNQGCNHIYSTIDEKEKTNYDYSMLFYQDAHQKRNNVFILGTALDNISYNFKNKISIVKIDVEGFELNVLNGAKKLILEHRPIIIVEIYKKINFELVLRFFEEINYTKYNTITNNMYNNEDYIFYP
jgi:FkbM family methyltransferase